MPQSDRVSRRARCGQSAPQWSVVLRALRESSGVTQAGWATRLGYGLRTIQRWEHGELTPDAPATHALVELCAGLGLLRSYSSGVLAGLTLTADSLRALLADARLAESDAPRPLRDVAFIAPATSFLPEPLTSFVGREREIAEIRRILRTSRLVSLIGPGGVGKTRLGIEVARNASPDFKDSVCLVELAPVADTRLVAEALATVLGVREQAGRSLLTTLTDRLRSRQLLVVLDNCEHVLDRCAELVVALLHVCPELRFLTTSRVVLGVTGETTRPVPALSLPDRVGDRGPQAVAQSEAVQLFVSRARAVAPGFTVTDDNSTPVADICTRLDGLPLAIELAAAWTRVLSPHELAERLVEPLALLVSTGQGAPARQRTLRATLDWSYNLLAEPERRVLARLSVLAGGAALDIVETVAKDQAETGPTVLASLARLVDASLVQRVDSPGAESRLKLLETVREYAGERLAEYGDVEVEDVRRRHAIAFRDLAERARAHLVGADQAAWLARLERDHDNMREALGWAIEHKDPELSGRLAASLSFFWYHHGHIREGRALLDAALALPASAGQSGARVAMLQGSGLLALHHGDFDTARRYAETGVAIAREMGNSTSLADILSVLGFVARVQEDWITARNALQECLITAREIGHRRNEGIALHHLGLLALEAEQDYAAAWSLSDQSLKLQRQIGDRRLEGTVLVGMARVARGRGDLETAHRLLEEAWRAHQEVGDPGVLSHLMYTRAAVAADERAFEEAVRLASAAASLNDFLGSQQWPATLRDIEQWLPRARRALGDERFDRAWTEGQAPTLQQTIAQAMAEADA